ncbi:MAG: uL15m family ribosomal protein [Candidatus Hadarchaeota archaeon]
MVRKEKKVKRQRGRRTYGKGCSKRGRGSGERGGTGMSGGHKHKWSYILRYMPDYFGKHGFTMPPEIKKRPTTINVGDIDECMNELLKSGVAKLEGEKITVDASKLGVDKVLGGGRVTRPIQVAAKGFSESAKKKLEEAGGGALAG